MLNARTVAPPPAPAARMQGVEGSAVREILAVTQQPHVLSLAGGLPAPELFDVAGLAAAYERVLRGPGARRHLQYTVTEGEAELREALAALTRGRGLDAAPADVLVTTGSQQALDLVATALLDPGDVVLVERPSYLAALQVFALAGARVVSVPLDDDGLDPEQVRAELRRHGARLVYTVANFQNPAGVTLAAERRRALARVAVEEGAWVLEDDPYGELRYRGDVLPPVAASEPARVIYASSLSKILAPGLRLGWLVLPPGLRDAVTIVKQARDLHTSTVDQRAAFEYLASGALRPHLTRIRAAYGARLDAMLAGLPAALPAGSRWTRPEGGMFLWLTLPENRDAGALLPGAVREGVAYVPGAPFFAEAPLAHTARVSFATLEPPQIAEALTRLARALA